MNNDSDNQSHLNDLIKQNQMLSFGTEDIIEQENDPHKLCDRELQV